MSLAEQIPLLSPEEYLAGELVSEVRHEYLGGYVHAMSGARTQHNRISLALNGSLYNQLRGKRCEAFNSDMKVRVELPNQLCFYYPDAMVVCEPNAAEDSYQERPVVIAEVLSESTWRTDMGEKKDAYLSTASLNVYLLVEQDRPRVTIHRRQGDGFEMELYDGLDAVVPLPEVEVELPLKELYERVEFAAK